MGVQQSLSLFAALAHNNIDEVMNQSCCAFPKAVLQPQDQGLHIQTIDTEIIEDAALCSLFQPPPAPEYSLQPLAQPGQHRVQEMLLLSEKFRPYLRRDVTYRLWPCSCLLRWG